MDNIKITPLLDTLRLEKISDEEYFSERYTNYISNSRLGLINPDQGGSIEKFINGFQTGWNQSFELGSAIHMLVLQENLFELADDIGKPSAKTGAIADYLYKHYINNTLNNDIVLKAAGIYDYFSGILLPKQIETLINKCIPYWEKRKELEQTYKSDKDIIYLDTKSRNKVCECVNALSQNKQVQDLLFPTGFLLTPETEMEKAILLDIRVDMPDVKPFILRLKAKVDNYTIDYESNTLTVNDVKSIGRVIEDMPYNIQAFHYNREIAFYAYLLNLCMAKFYNMSNPIIKGNYLCVSTSSICDTSVVPMTKKMFIEGIKEVKYLLRLVAKNIVEYKSDFCIWI